MTARWWWWLGPLAIGACNFVLAGTGYDFEGQGGAAASGEAGAATVGGNGGAGASGGSGMAGAGGTAGAAGAGCDDLPPPAACTVLSAGLTGDGHRGCFCGDCPGLGDGGAGGSCADAAGGGPSTPPRSAAEITTEHFCDDGASVLELAARGWESTNFANGVCTGEPSTIGFCEGWLQISPAQKTYWADTQGPLLTQRVRGDFGVVARVAVAFDNPASQGSYALALLGVRSTADPNDFLIVDFGKQLNRVGVASYAGSSQCPTFAGPQIPEDLMAPTVRLAFCRVGDVLRPLSDTGSGLEPAAADASGWSGDVDVGPGAGWYLGGGGVHALFDYVAFITPSSMSDCMTQLEALQP